MCNGMIIHHHAIAACAEPGMHEQALAPRQLPTKAGIEAELAKLCASEDGDGSEDEMDNRARQSTALAKEPPDYFGFVG